METTISQKGLSVRKGRTFLHVPHKSEIISFVSPPNGPGDYFEVQGRIESQRLRPPTFSETVSLVHSALNSDGEYGNAIRRIARESWFLGFTGNLLVPERGVYIKDNPKLEERRVIMNESELVKSLENGDESVRFVPFDYETEKMPPRKFEKNQYIIGLAGEEGAKKLAEIADTYKKESCLSFFGSVDKPLLTVSSLGTGWGGDRLGVGGSGHVGDRKGYAYGVFENKLRKRIA